MDKRISQLDSTVLLTGDEFVAIVQPIDNPKDNRKITLDQIGDFLTDIYGLISGHVILNSGVTLTQRENLNFINGLTASDIVPNTNVELGGILSKDTELQGVSAYNLKLGTTASRLTTLEFNVVNEVRSTLSGNNNVIIGKNITYTATGHDDYVLGIGHNISSPGGGQINWLFVSAEEATITNNAVGVINNSMIHGGFQNTIINGAGKQTFNANIVSGALNIIDNTSYSGTSTSWNFIAGRRNVIDADGDYGIVLGLRGRVTGLGGFVIGLALTDETTDPYVLSSGIHAINMSANSSAQTVGHGALSNYSAILGGYNHNIPSTSESVVILGGNTIKARASSPNLVYVPALNLVSIAGDYGTPGVGDVWYNSSTHEFRGRQNTTNYSFLTGTSNDDYWSRSSGGILTGDNTITVNSPNSLIIADDTLTYAIALITGSAVILQADQISIQGDNSGFTIIDSRVTPLGFQYQSDYTTLTTLSLIHKGFGDTNYWKLKSGGTLTGDNTISGSSNMGFTNTAIGVGIAPGLIPGDTKMIIQGNGTGTNKTLLLQDSEGGLIFSVLDNKSWGFNGVAASATQTGWTTSNVVTDRVLDANSTSLDEVADVLCTLIEDLKTKGILSI
ncbi:MAG TPA: hypothetical protein VFV86_10675 [Nitrososphaeraceae archaeon]|nr:hypothetical protein [Nitrososphaeraceae archaeon]